MAQIFISYSRVDTAFVEELYDLLRQMRPNDHIWYDQAPDGLLGGDHWWDEIMSAIAAADVFIYVLSNESVQSRYCRAEFEEARRLQKRIITIQARDRTRLTGELREIHYVDMKAGLDNSRSVAQLSGALDRQLSLVQKRHPLWQPRTPKPPNEAIPARRADSSEVDTPTLQLPSVEREGLPRQRGPSGPWATIIAALIAGVFTLGAAYIGYRALRDNDKTPPPTLTPTPDLVILAQTPVVDNADWKPVVQEFDGVEMVLVPAECFEMGSTQYDDEKPVHQVCFEEPFWIDRTEVTNGLFAAFSGQAVDASYFSGEDRPREQISWTEATAFCESRGARLPTEAEWEYAARGPDGLVYPWGSEWDQLRVTGYRSSNEGTARVGSKPDGASWVGAQDMSGNVQEWVTDWYGTYPEETQVNPQGSESGEYRVLRGGSWADFGADYFRAADRLRGDPQFGSNLVGFRCARSRGS